MTVAKSTDFIGVYLLVNYVSVKKNPPYFVQTIKIQHLVHHLEIRQSRGTVP
jgi:hypothetical protein